MKYKLGLCLSGGGVRGVAHIGVLKALEEHHVYPEALSGASAGSIVGAMYAAGVSPQKMLDLALGSSMLKAAFQGLGFPKRGLTDLSYLKEILKEHVKEDNFEHLQKRLFISISNLVTGKEEMRSAGPLIDVVIASCSIPFLFEPVEMNGAVYVDGGLIDNLPARPLRPRCETVIGVNVMPHNVVPKGKVKNIKEIALRCLDLAVWHNSKSSKDLCDICIEPSSLDEIDILDFKDAQKAYEMGYKAAMQQMPAILHKVLG